MSEMTLLRIGILIAGLILIGAIVFFGRPRKPGQGRRVARGEKGGEGIAGTHPGDGPALPVEPIWGTATDGQDIGAAGIDAEPRSGSGAVQPGLDLAHDDHDPDAQAHAANSTLGQRASEDFDKIVTLYLAARSNEKLQGSDIVVAAEKAGLVYGHRGVFHRLIDNYPERGPVFSVANLLKPGSFDMATIGSMETPAIAFFLTLPAPIAALDAWETMLPTVQRMAELLEGVVLDEQHNALGRQRIAHIRDEMRAYDRQRETPPTSKPTRW